jgi:hypothetical protein
LTEYKKLNIKFLIKEEGYESCLNDAPTIFAQSRDTVFSKFGDKIKSDIIAHLRSIDEFPWTYNFPYYSITKNTFTDLFDKKSSQIIMESIRKEILEELTLTLMAASKRYLMKFKEERLPNI